MNVIKKNTCTGLTFYLYGGKFTGGVRAKEGEIL